MPGTKAMDGMRDAREIHLEAANLHDLHARHLRDKGLESLAIQADARARRARERAAAVEARAARRLSGT
jgi:hypothetical protein